MLQSFKHGIGGLVRFSGRDRRGLFWPYALLVVFGSFFGFGAAMSSLAWSLLEATASSAASPLEGFLPFILMVGVTVVVILALLAAAVTRRLHDVGRSALWAMIPAALLVSGGGLFTALIASIQPSGGFNMVLFPAALLNNLIYMASVGLLIVFLILPGTGGTNRYGEPAA